MHLSVEPEQIVTYIRVERPVFDLTGVVLGAFGAAGVLVVVALLLGVAFGVTLILKRRREPATSSALDLDPR